MGIQSELIEKFGRIGARLKLRDGPLVLDIKRDRHGEYFDLRFDCPMLILDIEPKDKHLLLMAREKNAKPKFLCGFDERGWFAAALPEPQQIKWPPGTKPSIRRGISDINTAKAALKPPEIVDREETLKLKDRKKHSRHNKASHRQGEWFFVPTKIDVDASLILKNEPIRMGSRREHICEELYRVGGETVWVNSHYPNGISEEVYRSIPSKNRLFFRKMTKDATVYVRGRITAHDHAPLMLPMWHKVVPNNERLAQHSAYVAFLD